MKFGEQGNLRKKPKNPNSVHHRYHSTSAEIRTRGHSSGSPCSNLLKFRTHVWPYTKCYHFNQLYEFVYLLTKTTVNIKLAVPFHIKSGHTLDSSITRDLCSKEVCIIKCCLRNQPYVLSHALV